MKSGRRAFWGRGGSGRRALSTPPPPETQTRPPQSLEKAPGLLCPIPNGRPHSPLCGFASGPPAARATPPVLQTVIVLFMSACMLMMNFKANLLHSAWEVGVLRALGMREAAVLRLYVYEALCLVLSAFTLGTGVGIIVATVMTLQANGLLDMPLHFGFPYGLVAFTLVMALTAAVVGCRRAAVVIEGRPIVAILRTG